MKIVWSFPFGAQRVSLVEGSLAALGKRVGALVSSDDNYLSHGGGVSGALWEAAGPRLVEEIVAPPRLQLGDVFVSEAYELDADWLLHAITIDFDANRRLGPREARNLFGAALDQASALGCESVALPLLGSGAGRLTPEASATAALEALSERGSLLRTLRDVYLVSTGHRLQACLEVLEKRAEERRPLGPLLRAGAASGNSAAASLLRAWEEWESAPNSTSLARALDASIRLLSPTGTTGAEDTTPLAEQLRLASDAAREAAAPLPSKVRAALSSAIDARNRLLHASSETTADANGPLERLILAGIEASARWALGALPAEASGGELSTLEVVVSSPSAQWCRDELTELSPGPALGALTSQRSYGSAKELLSSKEPFVAGSRPKFNAGTDPARRLRHFLQEKLPASALEALLEELEDEGYRGPPDLRLLEFCVRLEEPASFLAGEFTIHQLREEYRSLLGSEPPKGVSVIEIAGLLLEGLGFPRQEQPIGLHAILQHLRAHRPALHTANLMELKGAIADAGGKLEYLIGAILRFICQAAYHQAPETFFRNLGRLKNNEIIARCSLGRLLGLLEALSLELEKSDPELIEFRRDVGPARLAPEGSEDIARLRNTFVHFDRSHEQLTLKEARRDAGVFYEQAIEFLEHLSQPGGRLFPIVIRIERITIDKWGRRLVEAVNDEGGVEQLFTDRQLEAGQIYFMHPLTNPLRVDPILVPAGEMIRERRA